MVQTAIRSYTSKWRQNFTRQHERRKLISLGKKCNCALQSRSSQFILLNTHHVKEKQGLIKVRVLLRVLDDRRMNHMSTTLKLNTWRRHTGQLISLHVTHAPTQHLRKKHHSKTSRLKEEDRWTKIQEGKDRGWAPGSSIRNIYFFTIISCTKTFNYCMTSWPL